MFKVNILKRLLSQALLLGAFVMFSVSAHAESVEADKYTKEAKQNTDYLLGNVLRKAKAIQETYGDFSPFGAGLFPNGKVKYVWLAKPGEVVKDPEMAIPVIRRALTAQAQGGPLLASAVLYKYGSRDAVQINVELEYVNGYNAIVGTKVTIEPNELIFGAASKKTYEPARVFVSEPVKASDRPEPAAPANLEATASE